MSDEGNETPSHENADLNPAGEEQPQGTEGGQAVPYERFAEVNAKAKEYRERVEALEAAERERAEAELSEVEKATKRAEEAEARAQELEGKATTLERSGWIREQARKAQFADPSDAVALLDLSELDSEEKVADAVAKLAEGKPHLIAAPQRPQPIGAPLGANGDGPQIPTGPDGKPDPRAGLGQELLGRLTGAR